MAEERPAKVPKLSNTRYAVQSLLGIQSEVLTDEQAADIADVVVGIYNAVPDKDPKVVSSILNAASKAAESAVGGKRRGGAVLTRSKGALAKTAKTGLEVLSAGQTAADVAFSTFIERAPAAVVGAALLNGGFVSIVEGVRDLLSKAPPPPEWRTFLTNSSDAIGSVVSLGGDVLPWAASPVGVMAIASFLMKYRAGKRGMSVWDLIKTDVSTVGAAAEQEYYSALSKYAANKLNDKKKVSDTLMSAIDHLKPTSLARDREAAETLASLASRGEGGPGGKGGRRSGRKTKKMRRKSRRVTRRHF